MMSPNSRSSLLFFLFCCFVVLFVFGAFRVEADNLLLGAAHGSDPDHGGSAHELLFAAAHGGFLGEISPSAAVPVSYVS